ncbi:peptidase A24 [Micromonospora sp. WMMD1082]|uniref:peptidase A24 n=1 Tax=Micromonospora sp. WMMD1082 TaxID=3016104 RepID=UPI002417B509|nr:peptidase A24 [Micromonospora sp. WMMD1082]MDG4795002.1 peptidase A24 [Micromonospora sp. WMMD1082]
MDATLWWGSAVSGALAGAVLPAAYLRAVARLRAGNAPRARRLRWHALASGGGAVVLASGSVALAGRLHERPGGVPLVAAWLILIDLGLLLAAVDAATHRLPTPLVGAMALTLGAFLAGDAFATGHWQTLVTALLAASAVGGAYLVLAAGGSMIGAGDVRFATVLAASLGTLGWPAVVWGGLLPYLLAGPEALARLALRRQSELAFGPYLLAGALLAAAFAQS